MFRVLALTVLILAPAWPARAQFMPELPRDEAALIRLLETPDGVFTQAKVCQRLAVVGTEAAVPALKPLLQHPQLSVYARTALERIPAEQAEEALIGATASLEGEALAGVLHSIGERRIERAAGRIADVLQHPEQRDDVRVAAASSLGKIATRDAAKALNDYAADAPTGRVRDAIAAALLASADAAQRRGDTELAVSLIQRIEEAAPDSAAASTAEHRRLLLSASDRPEQLRQALESESERRFRSALQAGRLIGEPAAPVIAGALQSLPPQRRSLALRCLADLGDPSVIEQIVPLVESSEPEVAQSAALAAARLGRWDDADRLPDVATADSPVARVALNELAKTNNAQLDTDVFERLEQLAAGESELSEPASLGLFEYAAERHLIAATEPLLELTRTGDSELRAAALRAAGATTSVEHFPDLLRRLQDSGADWSDGTTAEAIERAVVRLPQRGAADAIAGVMQDASLEKKVELLDYLALLGGDRALEIAADAARSEDVALVDAATRVLGQWLTADVAGTLSQLVRDLEGSPYRTRVLRGYLRVGRQLDMPTGARMKLAADAHALAQRDQERDLALDILRRYPAPQALSWLADQIRNERPASPSHRAAQYRTLAAVAASLAGDYPQDVHEALQNLPLDNAPDAPAATLRALREAD